MLTGEDRADVWKPLARLARPCGATAVGLLVWIGMAAPALASERVSFGYLALEPGPAEPVSLLDPVITDEGVQGARLALEDNNATGQFMGQEFEIEEIVVARDGDVATAFQELAQGAADFILSDLPGAQLQEIMALPEAGERVIFNVKAQDDDLRNEACAANLFHTTPSRAMLTDALAQFLMFKRWNTWALVVGNTPEDELYAASLRASATKFGAEVAGEKQWPHTPLARRAEGGFHAIQREVPVFLQNLPSHDVLLIADETDYFGEYFPNQTWLPRPVAGTQGLIAAAWHRAHESWGAVQLHRRFEDLAGRWMTERDFAAWVAVRSVGEAATRTQSVEPDTLVSYLLSEDFELGAYLGEPVTYRTWDRQLRQPVLVTGARMVASVSPQEGFLHQVTPLDTLGHDQPESNCQLG